MSLLSETKPIYLISDTHFGAGTAQEERLLDFSLFIDEVCAKGSALYLVGDIFDFWISYGGISPKTLAPVVALLQQTVESGIPVTLLRGNHEFMVDMTLQWAGISVVEGPVELLVGSKQIVVMHGHSLNTNRLFRSAHGILTNPFFQWCYKKLPQSWGAGFALWVSSKSRDASTEEACSLGSLSKYHRGVVALLDTYDMVLMGHTHHGEHLKLDSGEYGNSGSWLGVKRGYATLTQEGVYQLHSL